MWQSLFFKKQRRVLSTVYKLATVVDVAHREHSLRARQKVKHLRTVTPYGISRKQSVQSKYFTLRTLDFAICKIVMMLRLERSLIWSTMELKRALSCRQCSTSAMGPVSSASFLICSLSVNTWRVNVNTKHSWNSLAPERCGSNFVNKHIFQTHFRNQYPEHCLWNRSELSTIKTPLMISHHWFR